MAGKLASSEGQLGPDLFTSGTDFDIDLRGISRVAADEIGADQRPEPDRESPPTQAPTLTELLVNAAGAPSVALDLVESQFAHLRAQLDSEASTQLKQ